jgi:cytochrome c-type biogenesis protein
MESLYPFCTIGNEVSEVGSSVSIGFAFLAGILSFVSPCTLPLFPSYLGYITGVSFHQGHSKDGLPIALRRKAFFHALCFCLGLSFLFILLGYGATAFGQVLHEYKTDIRWVGGLLIVLMGLFMSGLLQWNWLLRERRVQLPQIHAVSYLGSVLVGIAFAAGWTPCIGPILATVLTMVVNNPDVGTWYMVTYALGFTLPFLILAVTLSSIRPFLRYTERLSRIGGWLLILMGVLLLSNKMSVITAYIQQTTHYRGF